MHSRSPRPRTFMAATAGIAALTVVLAGCGRADAPEDAASPQAIDDAPATGTIEIWAAGGDGEQLPEMFDLFQEQNPDVEINMTQVPEDDFVAKMTAAISGGSVPDLVYLFTEFQPTLLDTGGFSPVPSGLVDDAAFFDTAWDASVVDGVAYGVPWYTYARPFIIRTDLTEAAGAEVPTDWDGLRAWAETLQDSGVETPLDLVIPFNQYTSLQFDMFAHQAGGGLISDDLSAWTINDPANVEALEFWGSLYADGLASPDEPVTMDWVSYLSSGRSAGLYNGPWFRGWLVDANSAEWVDENIALIEPPAGPDGGRAAQVGGGNWAVPVDAANPDAAWKFARFMSEPENQLHWYEIFGNLPAVESVWDEPEIADNAVLAPIRDSISVGVTVPKVPTWGEVGEVVAEAMERVARGQAEPQEALDQAQAQAEAIGVGD
ncbi:extracellular solute-binding protein [Microbacter sp. GSS18]|nr:extracellular solute-binding protein [Microbacter sp. GSS18]